MGAKTRITPDEIFKRDLLKAGRKDLIKGFEVDRGLLERLLKESKHSHPKSSDLERYRWAAYSARTLTEKRATMLAKVSDKSGVLAIWFWRTAILGLLASYWFKG